MKKFGVIVVSFTFLFFNYLSGQSPSVFINEINYLASNPTERGIEIAGEAGKDLTGWSVVMYTAEGTVDFVEYLESGIIPDRENGHGVVILDIDQATGNGGIALVNNSAEVVQFLSYGISNYANVIITAIEGPAEGITSSYIGTQLLPDQSLQLMGTGSLYLDFTWSLGLFTTLGEVNINQSFIIDLNLDLGLGIGGLFLSTDQSGNGSAGKGKILARREQDRNRAKIEIYPNPSTEMLHVRLNGTMAQSITLVDVRGRAIRRLKPDATSLLTFRVGNLPAGTYYVLVEKQTGLSTYKVIKE